MQLAKRLVTSHYLRANIYKNIVFPEVYPVKRSTSFIGNLRWV